MTRQQLDKLRKMTDHINEMYDKAYKANRLSASVRTLKRYAY